MPLFLTSLALSMNETLQSLDRQQLGIAEVMQQHTDRIPVGNDVGPLTIDFVLWTGRTLAHVLLLYRYMNMILPIIPKGKGTGTLKSPLSPL